MRIDNPILGFTMVGPKAGEVMAVGESTSGILLPLKHKSELINT
jgi:hypothetical protein